MVHGVDEEHRVEEYGSVPVGRPAEFSGTPPGGDIVAERLDPVEKVLVFLRSLAEHRVWAFRGRGNVEPGLLAEIDEQFRVGDE